MRAICLLAWWKISTANSLVIYFNVLKLIEKGLTREDAYRLVQRNALDAFENDGDFRINLLNDKDVEKLLTPSEIDMIFNKDDFLKNVSKIYSRVLG